MTSQTFQSEDANPHQSEDANPQDEEQPSGLPVQTNHGVSYPVTGIVPTDWDRPREKEAPRTSGREMSDD